MKFILLVPLFFKSSIYSDISSELNSFPFKSKRILYELDFESCFNISWLSLSIEIFILSSLLYSFNSMILRFAKLVILFENSAIPSLIYLSLIFPIQIIFIFKLPPYFLLKSFSKSSKDIFTIIGLP